MSQLVDLETLVRALAARGVPLLILLVRLQSGGYVGLAKLAQALVALGGPLGGLEPFTCTLLLAYMAKGVADWGFEPLYRGMLAHMQAAGYTLEEVCETITTYPLARAHKAELTAFIRDTWECTRTS